jgi:hypothetical protein
VSAHKLNWSRTHFNDDFSALLRAEHLDASFRFDVIIASDCLFFREFHADLIHVLRRLVAPSGVIYLLQPARDGTMRTFLNMCGAFFDVQLSDSFYPEVCCYTLYGNAPMHRMLSCLPAYTIQNMERRRSGGAVRCHSSLCNGV